MKKLIPITLLAVVFLSSCHSTQYTRADRYKKMYEETPLTLLVMPPINKTNNVEAKDLLYTSVNKPLIECGYYLISPQLAMDVLKAESAYDAEQFINQPLKMFKDYFGADAVVFSEILKWKKRPVLTEIDVEIRYIIKSTTTNDTLFDRQCDLTLDLKEESANNSLLAKAIAAAVTVANMATIDNIVAARMANYYIFRDTPRGKYSPIFQKDKETGAEAPKVHATLKRRDVFQY